MPRLKKSAMSAFLRSGCERQLRLSLYPGAEQKSLEAHHGVAAPPKPYRRQQSAGLLQQAGYEWQDDKVAELTAAFGAAAVLVKPKKNNLPQPFPLREALEHLQPHQFVIEAQISIPDSFLQAFNLVGLVDEYGLPLLFDERSGKRQEVRPDVLQALRPMSVLTQEEREAEVLEAQQEVGPTGHLTPLEAPDERIRLRVVDIKLSADPKANYFAETVYYSMILAAWLEEEAAVAAEEGRASLSERFVIVASAAVWPGSYADSKLKLATRDAALTGQPLAMEAALEADLTVAPFDVYIPSLDKVFREQLPRIMTTAWQDLQWHTGVGCQTCEFFGYRFKRADGTPLVTPDGRHCYEQAEAQHLVKRVAGLTRGTERQLETRARTVDQLVVVPATDPVFKRHRRLSQQRHILLARAKSLQSLKEARDAAGDPALKTCEGGVSLIGTSGLSASMPRYSNLNIYIFMDYDLSSALTVSFSVRARWTTPGIYQKIPNSRRNGPAIPDADWELLRAAADKLRKKVLWGYAPREEGEDVAAPADPFEERMARDVMVVPPPSRQDRLSSERDYFLNFLKVLKGILEKVREQDRIRNRVLQGSDRKTAASTYQIYFWDDAQYRQMKRLISRHFEAIMQDADLRDVAWLFPAEQMVEQPEHATRESPITLLAPVVQRHLSLPVPYHFTLLESAEALGFEFKGVSTFFRDYMSNLVPGERIHEYWSGRSSLGPGQLSWDEAQSGIKAATRAKALAVSHLQGQLARRDHMEREGGGEGFLAAQAAPEINGDRPELRDVPLQSQLLYQFTKLGANIQMLERQQVYALPPTERVDVFEAAFLPHRFDFGTPEYDAALDRLNQATAAGLEANPDLLIYSLSPGSTEIKVKPGDFDLALSPVSQPHFLDLRTDDVVNGSFEVQQWQQYVSLRESGLTKVTLAALDRDKSDGLIALRASSTSRLADLEQQAGVDFSRKVMLDKLTADYFSIKLLQTLQGLRGPLAPPEDAAIARALYDVAPTGHGCDLPGHDFIFRPKPTSQEEVEWQEDVKEWLQAQLLEEGRDLNSSQWNALERFMKRRLAVLWGPPGTGKSATLRAVIRAAIRQAQVEERTLRILVATSTYTAVDNVIMELVDQLQHVGAGVDVYRLASESRAENMHDEIAGLRSVVIGDGLEAAELFERLQEPTEGDVFIVGTTQHQIHKLSQLDAPAGRRGTVAQKAQRAEATQRAWFDLIIVDEASQLDVASSTLIFSKAAPGAQALVAGDGLQLPPIHAADPPEGLENRVGSVFDFLVHEHGLERFNLEENYRSNDGIVRFTHKAGYDSRLQAHSPTLELQLRAPLPATTPAVWPARLGFDPLLAELLNPEYPLVALLYDDDLSSQSNDFEALLTSAVVAMLQDRAGPPLNEHGVVQEKWDRTYDLGKLLDRGVGVVAPHRAQGSLTVTRLAELLRPLGANYGQIRAAVDTVERFQGGQRDVIVASFGLGDPDLIASEDEFLYDIRRFNVLVTRARVKVIVLMSRSVLLHLSDDQDVARDSRLLKAFVRQFCTQVSEATITYTDEDGVCHAREIEVRLGK
ncbi:DEAD/DEAH box helicase [Deinococcus planocerae]|uniref:DEAD/DEAH box helicase n=1 Tax=Deinococcus planocerae TaxID=1737569 RepID=UPI0011AFC5AA|nr:DEAD/DEAH box helicase [Deinococcus planocerae]